MIVFFNNNYKDECMQKIKDLEEAISIYNDIVESEEKHGEQFYAGKIDEQTWVDTVYRVMNFPSYDVNWNEISMSKELIKEFQAWELNQRKKLPASKL